MMTPSRQAISSNTSAHNKCRDVLSFVGCFGEAVNTGPFDSAAAGNRTSDGYFTFTYDNRGRLVGSRVSTALAGVTYGINGLGQRVYKDVAKAGDANNDGVFDQSDIDTVVKAIASTGVILGNGDCNNDSVVNVQDLPCINTKRGQSGFDRVLFVYDEAGHLIGEYRKNGASFTTLKEYVWLGDVPVAVLSGGQIYRIFADHLGTPRDIMNSADQVVWSWTNGVDPMGAMQPDEDPDRDNTRFVFNLRFPGQYYDIENGLHYNYFRTYDPTTGRYLEPDPIGLAGGMNLYSYTSGDPVNRYDAAGLFESPWYLKWVPGQTLWDQAVTAYQSGNSWAAAGYASAMVTEQALTVASLGIGRAATGTTQCLTQTAGTSAAKIELGSASFNARNGVGQLYSPSVVQTGNEIVFNDFAVGTARGLLGGSFGAGAVELLGPMRQLVAFSQQKGASSITLRGTYVTEEGARLGGGRVGEEFSFSFSADAQGLRNLIEQLGN